MDDTVYDLDFLNKLPTRKLWIELKKDLNVRITNYWMTILQWFVILEKADKALKLLPEETKTAEEAEGVVKEIEELSKDGK